jgi:hypothetical protein
MAWLVANPFFHFLTACSRSNMIHLIRETGEGKPETGRKKE